MQTTLVKFKELCFQQVSSAPLVVFRILFSSLLFYSTVRTIFKGWVKELYVIPTYHFTFIEGLPLPSENVIYSIFGLLALSSLFMIFGLFYRVSTALFFVLFTYVELIDKTYYLNHYYLVSTLVFWMVLVPAHRSYSIDSFIFPKIKKPVCDNWCVLIFKVQLSMVYFFAGLAKVNADWLVEAQPLATWLPGRYSVPIIGKWLYLKEVAFLFSWSGCLYDLFIWIFLWFKRARPLAYLLVLIFHILTGILFPRIGMFPYIMIVSTVIFFSANWHQKLLTFLPFKASTTKSYSTRKRTAFIPVVLMAYLIIQLYLPLRHLQHPGNLFWNEDGYRFSWRVMLMEKNGYTNFISKDPKLNLQKQVDLNNYLTAFQQQQLRSQPDMILQFAKHIGKLQESQLGYAPEIYVDSRISLNGRRSQLFIDQTVDLYNKGNFNAKNWLIPLSE
jgi:hypothetical protein